MQRLNSMCNHCRMRPILFALLIACTSPLIVAADHDAVLRAVESGRLKSLEDILQALQREIPGRVLDVELERGRDGQPFYEITWLDASGQRHEILVDAVSGQRLVTDEPLGVSLQPLAQILRRALEQHPGRVLEVELERDVDDREFYEIKISQVDGRVRELMVDAHSGELLANDPDHELSLQALIPLPELLEALPERAGTVREVELGRSRDGRFFYEIELGTDDGGVLEFRVDAMSGQPFGDGVLD